MTTSKAAPTPARPHVPGYGISGAMEGEGLLPWQWAEDRLRASHNYWVSTVTDTGLPHTMPVWGVWLDDTLLFSTGWSSRKARNLQRQIEPRCTATTESAAEAVIVEGCVTLVASAAAIARLLTAYTAKYGDGFPPESAVFRVVPQTVFAFIERDGRFTTTATRWRFSD